MSDLTNHIGIKAWRRLSRNQKQIIIKDRANGRAHFFKFKKEREIRLRGKPANSLDA